MSLEIRMLKEERIDEYLDQSIRKGLCICFSPDKDVFSKSRFWHGTSPAWTVLIEENSEVLAHVGIVERRTRVGSEQVDIAGVQNVFVLPNHRVRGFFFKIMKASMEEAARLGHDFGLLFCAPKLEKLYARCEWRLLPQRKVTRVDDSGEEADLPSKNITMYYPLARSEFPLGDIHLQGNDW